MNNKIYLDFKGDWYHINLLTPAGSVWIVEWGDGASKRHISTGEWQWDSHGYDFSEGSFHTFISLQKMERTLSDSVPRRTLDKH